MVEDTVVRVGGKSKTEYITAILFSLDRFGEAQVRGLGQRQSTVLDIAESVSKIDNVEIRAINGIKVNDTSGLEVIITREEGGKFERSQ